MCESTVSGNIVATKDSYYREGETYVVRSPVTGQGWGLPVSHLEPDDLRILADRIEAARAIKSNSQAHGISKG